MRDITDLLTSSHSDDELQLDGYEVRQIPEYRAEKDYICPDCGNTVPVGEAHVVVWPTYDSDLRRHWHQHCWRLEVRRGAS